MRGFSRRRKMKEYAEKETAEDEGRKGPRRAVGVGARARVRVRGPARERPPGIRSIGCARARGGSRVSVTGHPLSDEHVSSHGIIRLASVIGPWIK